MQTPSGRTNEPVQSPAKVAFASFIGTAVEWYDYFLFGTAAVLIFNHQFFPDLDPLAATLASLSTFAVAFVARPLGGIIFGHFGDRASRKTMLVWSLLGMGIATFAIGLLPNYATIGAWAPILLVLLRVIQGIAVGGEWGGAVLMALEHAPKNKKSFYASWPQAGVPAGVVMSSLAFYLVQLLPTEQLHAWGWRLPFLFSAVLIVVGMVIRLKITESPEFEQMKADKKETKIPLFEMLRTAKRPLLIGTFALAGSNTLFYVATVYLLSYGTESIELEQGSILLAISVGATIDIIAIPAVAVLADKYGRRTMMIIGSVITIVAAFPIFWLFNLGTSLGIYTALILALPIAHSFVYATVSGFIATLYGPEVRFTGTSMSYQLGGILASAPAPILSTMLYSEFGTYAAVAWYLVAANVVALVAVLFAPRDSPTARQKHETPTNADQSSSLQETT